MTPEEVERALGSLRHDDPLPDDIAARLDAGLADLVAEREESPEESAPAGSPRHRRWLWVAAAACLVAIAGGPLVQRLDLGASSGADQAATAESAGADDGASVSRDLESGPPVALTSRGFAEQARAVAAGELGAPEGDPQADPEGDTAGGGVGTLGAPEGSEDADPSTAPSPRASSEVCRPPAVGGAATRFVPATYDGTPATLVLRDGVATLWACDGTRVLNEAAVSR
ncbi:hypothetical protein GCM10027425_24390 [Alteromonas gracilis]